MEVIDEKIQLIAKEMSEANANTWTITKIINELSKLNTRNDTKLRENALKLLQKMDPLAAKTYETFSKMKVYTTNQTVQNFNRGQIIQSLLKETNISRSVAEKLTLEVENEIKDSKIEFLSAPLIRELVNAKLTLYGFEKIRRQYTRVGTPCYEIKKRINNEAYFGEELQEYNLLNVLSTDAIDLHFNGTIFIEDITGFSNRPFTYSFLAEKFETIDKTIIKNVKKLLKFKNYFANSPNLHGIGFVSAGFVKKESDTKKIAKKIKTALEFPTQDFFNYLELYTPKYLELFSENRLNAAAISNNLTLDSKSIFGVDSKFGFKLITNSFKNAKILNNSKEELIPFNENLFSTKNGIDLFVNLNLEKFSKDEDKIFEEIEEISKVIEKIKLQKKELLSQKSYLKEFNVGEMQTGIGITNLFSLGKEINGKEKEFANKAIKELSKIFKEDLIFGIASNKAIEKFSKESEKEIYSHNQLNFKECINSKKICFSTTTKSIHEVEELIENNIKLINFEKN